MPSSSRLFLVSGSLDSTSVIPRESFVNLNIWERTHIEEWVRNTPEILGEELLILTIEFDFFVQSRDRLDVLALDHNGNLVVIELKRDVSGGYADLQAIRYAAMVSSMTIQKLIPHFRAYRSKYYSEELTDTEAIDCIKKFVDLETFTQLSNKPRIILCSEDFSQEITTSVLWLREFNMDISCVEIVPYKVRDSIIIASTVVIPLKSALAYQIEIKSKEEEREQAAQSGRLDTMRTLLDNGAIKEGQVIFFKNGLPPYVQYDQGSPVFEAVVTGKYNRRNAIKWKKDDTEYSLSGLAWKILKDLHPENKDPGGLSGKWYWTNAEGVSLGHLEEQIKDDNNFLPRLRPEPDQVGLDVASAARQDGPSSGGH